MRIGILPLARATFDIALATEKLSGMIAALDHAGLDLVGPPICCSTRKRHNPRSRRWGGNGSTDCCCFRSRSRMRPRSSPRPKRSMRRWRSGQFQKHGWADGCGSMPSAGSTLPAMPSVCAATTSHGFTQIPRRTGAKAWRGSLRLTALRGNRHARDLARRRRSRARPRPCLHSP